MVIARPTKPRFCARKPHARSVRRNIRNGAAWGGPWGRTLRNEANPAFALDESTGSKVLCSAGGRH